ncbi:hypothetical protein M409DRAFT_24317 [Zasmidium cellare ATCC 36951]|uniref:Uncharacterized protein n=1 Tax=Zasmidium cellare ATCC 36951 TaxID=1080233 RepID=A0A6A6CE17_ZASCE|nr:uncharacterized protein M409DRAFT_24317 [Zasmidium cellare ATCC 36951]KAF2165467.1 hypothetical protein M409DRAFT_24317 [Zasmidium cellare ATCC 36951]
MPAVEQWRKAADAAGPSRRSLLRGINSLYKTRDYSDLVIKCGSREWAHETKDAVIELHHEHEDVIDQLVEYLYTSEYDDELSMTSHSPHGPMHFDVKMYTAADKLDIPDLADLAVEKFIARAERYTGEKDFYGAVHELHKEAPDTATKMRDAIVTATIRDAHVLFQKDLDSLVADKNFQRLVCDVPAFGMEVVMELSMRVEEKSEGLRALKAHFKDSETWHCGNCEVNFHVTNFSKTHCMRCPCCQKDGLSMIHRSMSTLYQSDWNCDLIIKGGSEKEWKAHTIIVCLQSDVFKKACKPEWQVRDADNTSSPTPTASTDTSPSPKKDSKQSVIDLSDERDFIIEQLVRFLYLATYDTAFCKKTDSPLGPMQFNLKMFIAADKYDVPDFADYAKKKFLSELDKVDSPAEEQDFIRAVKELYKAGPTSAAELRAKAVEAGTSNAHILLENGLKMSSKSKGDDLTFHRLIRDFPDFGDPIVLTLSVAFAEKKKSFTSTLMCRCDACRNQFNMTWVRNDVKVYCPVCREPARRLY